MNTAAKQYGLVYVASVGLAAPGLADWPTGQPVLRGESRYAAREMPRYAPGLLPPNERRRTTRVGRLAFQAAEEAIRGSAIAADQLAAVFASASGDTEVVDRICRALAGPDRAVSPTDFHNSVHNAAAGYWSIATRSRQSSTSLSAFDSSFAAGLMEAVSLVILDARPILLVGYDIRPPPPLWFDRPLLDDFSSALLLTPHPHNGGMALRLEPGNSHVDEATVEDPGLEALRQGNSAARALPLLCALAKRGPLRLGLPYFDRCITVDVQPC
jgi:hypothetical protein